MKKLAFPALALAVIGTYAVSLNSFANDFLQDQATLNIEAVIEDTVEIGGFSSSTVILDVEDSFDGTSLRANEPFYVNRRGAGEGNFISYTLTVNSLHGGNGDQFYLMDGNNRLSILLDINDSAGNGYKILHGSPMTLVSDGNMANTQTNQDLTLHIPEDWVNVAQTGDYSTVLTMTVAAP